MNKESIQKEEGETLKMKVRLMNLLWVVGSKIKAYTFYLKKAALHNIERLFFKCLYLCGVLHLLVDTLNMKPLDYDPQS